MESIFQIKFSRAQRKSAAQEFWGGFAIFSMLIAAFDKIGDLRVHPVRLPRSWEELLNDLPYILLIAFIISLCFYLGELYAIKKSRRRDRDSNG
jgi:hypothetical protein